MVSYKELISTIIEVFAEYEIESILKLVVERIPKLVNGRQASLFWFDREINRFVLKQTSGPNRRKIGKHAYAIGEGLTGWVAKTGKPLRIANIEDKNELRRIDPKLRWSDKYKGFEGATERERQYCRAFLAVPIKIESVIIGVLRVAKTMEPNARFSYEHEELMVTLAEHLSSILIKAERFQRAEQINKLIDHDYLGDFESEGELDNYFNIAVNLIPSILNSSGCTMFLQDGSSNNYVLRYASQGNPLEDSIGKATYKANEGLTGYVLQTQRSLRINDIQNPEELHQIDPKLKWRGVHLEFQKHHSNFLAAPIRAAKDLFGVIRLSKQADGMPFTEDDERLLSKYGRLLGRALKSFQTGGGILVRPRYSGRHSVSGNDCYVIMPYSQEWSPNTRRAIANAVKSQDLNFRIADEEDGRHVMEDVWRGLCESKVIIADLSTANPNVMYEVGLADVLGKEVILLAQDSKKVPFDLSGSRVLVYSPERLDKLEDDLSRKLSRVLRKQDEN
ncbi:MAG TPA: GAF domain-containing protein [Pyrinomonadaceae bacterium]|nr:GAF domain-containing protein [Pyrinomonadaceae bacterium]